MCYVKCDFYSSFVFDQILPSVVSTIDGEMEDIYHGEDTETPVTSVATSSNSIQSPKQQTKPKTSIAASVLRRARQCKKTSPPRGEIGIVLGSLKVQLVGAACIGHIKTRDLNFFKCLLVLP